MDQKGIKMIQVTKRNGKKEPLDIEKLHKIKDGGKDISPLVKAKLGM